LTKQIEALKKAPYSKENWDLIHKKLTYGEGELFFHKLKESGAYAILFPPVPYLSPKQQQENEAWLESRIKLFDISFKENNPFYDSSSAVLMLVNALPENPTAEDIQKTHTDYHIPFPLDEEFKKHVEYVQKRKQQFLNEQRSPYIALKKIYAMTYLESKETPTQAEIDRLESAPRNEEFWKLIREGFMNGKSEQFLKTMQQHGVYQKLFPPTSFEALVNQAQNDAWIQASLAELDAHSKTNKPRFLRDLHQRIPIAIIILFVKELSANPSDEEQRRVYDKYQISYAYDDFIKGLQFTNAQKHTFLKETNVPSNELVVDSHITPQRSI